MAIDSNILSIAKRHLQDIEAGKTGLELARFYDERIVQTEYPNRLNPNGGSSNYNTLIERSEKGKHIIVKQSYDIINEYTAGNTVILEVTWTAVLSIPIGQTAAGQEIKANFALFMEFENGKIIRQRNYDCFAPF